MSNSTDMPTTVTEIMLEAKAIDTVDKPKYGNFSGRISTLQDSVKVASIDDAKAYLGL